MVVWWINLTGTDNSINFMSKIGVTGKLFIMTLQYYLKKRTILQNIKNRGSWDNSYLSRLWFLSIEGVSMSLELFPVSVSWIN